MKNNPQSKEIRLLYWVAILAFIFSQYLNSDYEITVFLSTTAIFLITKAFLAKNKNKTFWILFSISILILTLFTSARNPFYIMPKILNQASVKMLLITMNFNYGYIFFLTLSTIILMVTLEWQSAEKIAIIINISSVSIALLLTNTNLVNFYVSGVQPWVIFLIISTAGFLISSLFPQPKNEIENDKKAIWGGVKPTKKRPHYVVKFGSLEWDDRDFPRGWSITGETGSGKTEAAFKSIFIQLCLNRPEWGGVLVDQKGNLHEEMESILKDLKLDHKILLLKTRPRNAPENWTPQQKFNLLSIPWIDDMTYAKMICDVAVSAQGGKGDDKSFFSTQALIQIASGIKLLRIFAQIQNEPIYKHVGLAKLYILLSSHIEVSSLLEVCTKKIEPIYNKLLHSNTLLQHVNPADGMFRDTYIKIDANLVNLEEMKKRGRSVVLYTVGRENTDTIDSDQLKKLRFHPEAINYYLDLLGENWELINTVVNEVGLKIAHLKILRDFAIMASHFNEKFLAQPPDQLGGVTSTIFNYLMFFNEPEVAEVFSCEHNTFDFCEAIDSGKIIMVTMPQAKAVHRIFINTTLKLLFYQHALSRFDLTKAEREAKNLIVLFADEAQGVVSKMEGGGFEDHAVADKIRQANATIVFATQDLMSYETKIGKERSATLQLNLANKIVFKCATPESSDFYSKCFGKKQLVKETGYSTSKQGKSSNFQTVDEPIFKDYELNTLRKFEAVVKHCEHPPVKMILPPVDSFGNVTTWGKKIIKRLKT